MGNILHYDYSNSPFALAYKLDYLRMLTKWLLLGAVVYCQYMFSIGFNIAILTSHGTLTYITTFGLLKRTTSIGLF